MGGGRKLFGLGLVMLLISLAAAGCGSSGSSSGNRGANKGCGKGCGNAGPAAAPAPLPSEPAAQLGCHQYCKQAGGYGGGGGPSPPPAAKILTSGTVEVASSGVVPIKLQCELSSPCRGAILLDAGSACSTTAQVGRSDLAVDPRRSRTIGVPLSSCQLSLLRRRGQLKVGITADTGASAVCKQYDCVIAGAVTLRSSA